MATLRTQRLVLRPFELSDAPAVQRLAGDPEIAATMLTIAHPYPLEAAVQWISGHEKNRSDISAYEFAIEDGNSGQLVGCISIGITAQHRRGTLGYWIGKEFWNRGYCTEAARAVIEFGFSQLKLVKINAHHLAINPASGKVMANAGMVQEGYFRQHVIKDGVVHDCVFYGITPASS